MNLKTKEKLFWLIYGAVFVVAAVVVAALIILLTLHVQNMGGTYPKLEAVGVSIWLAIVLVFSTKAFEYYDKEIYHAER